MEEWPRRFGKEKPQAMWCQLYPIGTYVSSQRWFFVSQTTFSTTMGPLLTASFQESVYIVCIRLHVCHCLSIWTSWWASVVFAWANQCCFFWGIWFRWHKSSWSQTRVRISTCTSSCNEHYALGWSSFGSRLTETTELVFRCIYIHVIFVEKDKLHWSFGRVLETVKEITDAKQHSGQRKKSSHGTAGTVHEQSKWCIATVHRCWQRKRWRRWRLAV